MKFKNKDKTLLILDLDETLIHATDKQLDYQPADFQVPPYFVYKRPFLHNFLQQVQQHFLLAVWSSASDDYVTEIVKKIFGEELTLLEFFWGRSRCTFRINPPMDEYRNINLNYSNHHHYLKTLKKLKRKGYNLKRILIVDDTPQKLSKNYGNAIYVKEFLGDPDDNELPLLLKYLRQLKDEENVRMIEKRSWRKRVTG